jgi:hypothetical protein
MPNYARVVEGHKERCQDRHCERIGGWKTPSRFRRHSVVDERDLTEAAERLSTFLTGAASTAPIIVPLAAARAARATGEHGQSRLFNRCTGRLDCRRLLNSILGEGRGPVASPVFKPARRSDSD